jgi:hypothetical protein
MFYDTEFINFCVANSSFYITFLWYRPVSLTDNLLNLYYQVLLNNSCISTMENLTYVWGICGFIPNWDQQSDWHPMLI